MLTKRKIAMDKQIARWTLKSGMVSCVFGGIAMIVGVSAIGGEYTPLKGSGAEADGGQYKFTRCGEPTVPVLGLDPAKKGNASVRDYNAQVARYNAFIVDMRTYMDCLSDEADQDLQAYYDAVSVSLEEKQSSMMARSNSLRESLAKGPNIGRAKPRARNIPALEGGEPVKVNPKGAILPPIENKPLIRLENEDG